MLEPVNRLAAVDAPQVDDQLTLDAEVVAASTPFVGQWNEVESVTNWEKGRIILEWRTALERSEAPAAQYSDQAWAQLVGEVTSQHVGRLRRVYARFGEVRTEYAGLYWSHFQAAMDWPDAEMWLEGAVQNGWSISQMRAARWEVAGDLQQPADESRVVDAQVSRSAASTPAAEEEEEDSTEPLTARSSSVSAAAPWEEDSLTESTTAEPRERLRPFEQLPSLPTDIAEAFEQFKLAILTHKFTGWSEISRADVLSCLESLKTLALAPAEG